MKNLKNIQVFYFVGIGGIGMSALARYFKLTGKHVMGYDKTPSAITAALIEEGIQIGFIDEISEIPELVLTDNNALIVYTPAIPKQNQILQYFVSNNYSVQKRAALLGAITKNTRSVQS